MYQVTLDEAIQTIAAVGEMYQWHTPQGAQLQCGAAAYGFVLMMQEWGFDAYSQRLMGRPDYAVSGRADWFPLMDDDNERHIVGMIGDVSYDFTARQYSESMEYPRIRTKAELESEGWTFCKGEKNVSY